MHRPAAVEAAPSPEKGGECAHTASRPYSAAGRAPVSGSARSALDKVRLLFKQHHHSLQQTIFECTAALNSTRDGPMGHGSGCLLYGAFVAAVVTMVSVLAWASAWAARFEVFACRF